MPELRAEAVYDVLIHPLAKLVGIEGKRNVECPQLPRPPHTISNLALPESRDAASRLWFVLVAGAGQWSLSLKVAQQAGA